MKKKYLMWAGGVVIAALAIGSIIFVTGKKMQAEDAGSAFGEAVTEAKENTESGDVLTAGDLEFAEGDLEEYAQIREAADLLSDDSATEEEIVEDYLEKEAMYALAAENGYTAEDVDYEAYKTSMTEAYESAENKEDVKSFFSQFGSLEDYFDVMEDSLRKSLAVRNYLDSLMTEYAEETDCDTTDADFVSEWLEKEEEIKNDTLEDAGVTEEEITTLVDYISD